MFPQQEQPCPPVQHPFEQFHVQAVEAFAHQDAFGFVPQLKLPPSLQMPEFTYQPHVPCPPLAEQPAFQAPVQADNPCPPGWLPVEAPAGWAPPIVSDCGCGGEGAGFQQAHPWGQMPMMPMQPMQPMQLSCVGRSPVP